MSDPIFITLGPLSIRWYGVFLALGAIAGYVYARWIEKRLYETKRAEKLFFPLLVWGLIGARIYHVINELPFYIAQPAMIPALWHGGLAIHGGIIAGAIYLWYYARKQRVSFLSLADTLMPSLMLGQAIGRWGNFFNQELFGLPTTLQWGMFIAPGHRPEAFAAFTRFHPTFLYESLWNLVIAALVALWIKKRPPRTEGAVFAVSLIGSGLGRTLIELLRIDAVPLIAGIRLPLIISAVLACGGALLVCSILKKTITANS